MIVTTEELFSAALLLPVSERDHFLQRACGSESERYLHVRGLLEALPSASEFFKEPHNPHGAKLDDLIDSYRLLQELGQGGGGVVYLAEQVAPIKREVALKIIKLGMDTRAVINRFEAERQALAIMDHPNIAKVFAAGATPTGRPYFVMELVRGIRITHYCAQCRLTVKERLELFIQVCNAIEHAHQQHIVHRDIKPSNVLVTLHGGMPLAKVIDFGVAKATQGRLINETVFTLVDQFIGTPAYVSPEQTASLRAATVDARSDIYSLGVLLYELLIGVTPLDPHELSGATLEEVRRKIREDAPVVPSKRVRMLVGEPLDAIVSQRRVGGACELFQVIRGDLDWIVMRCLEKDKDRRYRSASDLAADLTRYLQERPVLARPPSASYAFRKFAARHRTVFATVSIVISSLLIATGVSIWQAVKATSAQALASQERARAEQVSQFLLKVFSAADPFLNFGKEPTARDLLDQAARNIRNDLNQQPEVRARLLEGIGRSYRSVRELDKAAIHLKEALRLRREVGGDHAGLGSTLVELAGVVRSQGYIDESDRLLADAQRIIPQSRENRSEAHADLLMNLGALENWRGHPQQALKYATQALELTRELKGPNHPNVGTTLTDIANIMLWNDDFEGAERVTREALKIFANLPGNHPDGAAAAYQLGEVLFYRGELGEAGELFERVLTAQRELFGVNGMTTNALGSLAQVRLIQGDLEQAEKLVGEAQQAHRRSNSADVVKLAYLQTLLARIRIRENRFSEAVDLLRTTRDQLERQVSADHQYAASAEHYLGEALLAQHRFGEAEKVLTGAIQRWRRNGAPAWRAARSENTLGEVLHKLGRPQEAKLRLVSSYRVLMTATGVDGETRRIARERIAQFLEENEATTLDAVLSQASSAGPGPTDM